LNIFCLVSSATQQDSGEYTIIAENQAGSAETTAVIIVVPKIDNMEASQIFDVEDAREIQYSSNAGQISAPQFLQPISDFNCEYELGRSYFEARYEPKSGKSILIIDIATLFKLNMINADYRPKHAC
jgi:hypothetical protein